jgi:hypothetical protein
MVWGSGYYFVGGGSETITWFRPNFVSPLSNFAPQNKIEI